MKVIRESFTGGMRKYSVNDVFVRLRNYSLIGSMAFMAVAAGVSEAREEARGVVREIWRDIRGSTVESLTRHPSYQKPAPERQVVERIDDHNLGDYFGARYTALLEVPETGDYVFYIASDDSSELWIGRDNTQNDLTCIAFVKGFTYRHNWQSQINQKSAPVRLEKGKKYYLSVLHKEEKGEDFVSIAWTGPRITEPVIIPPEAFTQP